MNKRLPPYPSKFMSPKEHTDNPKRALDDNPSSVRTLRKRP